MFLSFTSKTHLRKQARLILEVLEKREVPYAVSGNAWPHPELITIGFVPDGSIVDADSSGPITSNLNSAFNARFGSANKTSATAKNIKASVQHRRVSTSTGPR